MKAVVGIDLAGHYEPALDTLLRLGFKDLSFNLVHAVEPLPAFIPELGPAAYSTGGYLNELRNAGEAELRRAEARACGQNATCEAHLADGTPALMLMEFGDSLDADLIAVGFSKKDRISAALFGSVGRALAISAKQSILVSKTEGTLKEGPLTAVFATDHSEYANKCVEKLLSWAPKGLRTVHVTHAYDLHDKHAQALQEHVPETFESAEAWVEHRIEQQTKDVAAKFEAAGIPTQVLVAKGHPNDVIRTEMHATNADLLIVGAQGHGFLERLVIGSVSLHQVVGEAYSVLVVRV